MSQESWEAEIGAGWAAFVPAAQFVLIVPPLENDEEDPERAAGLALVASRMPPEQAVSMLKSIIEGIEAVAKRERGRWN